MEHLRGLARLAVWGGLLVFLSMMPHTSLAGLPNLGSNDGNIQWDELYHNANGTNPTQEFVPDEAYTFRDVHPTGSIYDDTNVRLTIMTSQYELDGAQIRVWNGSGEVFYGMSWYKNWTGAFRGQASHTYDLWQGTIAPHSAGTTIFYYIRLYDDADEDFLAAHSGNYTNPLGQAVNENAPFGNDWSYTVQDDDTSGPQYSNINWNTAGPGANYVCANVYDNHSESGDNDSGIYDDGTGSGGQGMYLRWSTDQSTVNGGGGTEERLSHYSGSTYCGDSPIDPGVQFYFRIYAHNNDYDNGSSADRDQSNSGTHSSVPSSGATQDGDVWWNEVYHDTRDLAYRTPFGAVPTGQPVTIVLRTAQGDLSDAALVTYNVDVNTDTDGTPDGTFWNVSSSPTGVGVYDYYTFVIPGQPTTRVLHYKFRLRDGTDCDWYVDDHAHNSYDHEDRFENGTGLMVVGQSGTECGDSAAGTTNNSFNIMVYDAAAYTNHLDEWAQNAIIYQIMPDRFRNGDDTNDEAWPAGYSVYGNGPFLHSTWNESVYDPRDSLGGYYQQWSADFYGGDLQGIIDELDYLQSIGVTALYLNPIFSSPSNHGYDTSDYLNINPRFGDNALFATLAEEAEDRGIYLILDGVFNHTGSDSVYFDRYNHWDASGNPSETPDGSGACENESSVYETLYTFLTGPGPCTGRTNGNQAYNSWWGYDSLPLLNENTAVKNLVFDYSDDNIPANHVIQYWYSLGADGWRFDVADEVSHSFWQEFRAQVKNTDNLNGPLYTEVWYEATPWLFGDQFDSTMNYRYRKAVLGFLIDANWTDNDNNNDQTMWKLSPSELDYVLGSVREDYPAPAWYAMMNLMGSHDTNRALHVLREQSADLNTALAKMEMMAALQMTYPGAPTIYYGDEVGAGARDYDGYGQWGAGKSVGGIMQDDPYNRHPYPWDDESGSLPGGLPNTSLRDTYQILALTRNNYDVLRTGDVTTLLADDTNQLYAYARTDGNGEPACAIAIFNRGSSAQNVLLNNLPTACQTTALAPAVFEDVLNGGADYTVSGSSLTVNVAGLSSAVLVTAFSNNSTISLPPIRVETTTAAAGIPANGSTTVSATIYDVAGQTVPAGMEITFSVLAGRGSLTNLTAITNGSGVATVTYDDSGTGTDAAVIEASVTAPGGVTYSNAAVVLVGYNVGITARQSTQTGIGPQTVSLPTHVEVIKRGNGEPTISLAVFDDNPHTGSEIMKTEFVDVHLVDTAGVDEIEIRAYCQIICTGSEGLWWWNGNAWIVFSETGQADNYVWGWVTSSSTPSLTMLTGTPIAGGSVSPTAITLDTVQARELNYLPVLVLIAVLIALATGVAIAVMRRLESRD